MKMEFKPKGEIVWASYYDTKGRLIFFITSKPPRDYYFLYEISDDGKPNKLGKGKTPIELEKKYSVIQKIKNNNVGGKNGLLESER